jgi:SAM-dependent methyltransferase
MRDNAASTTSVNASKATNWAFKFMADQIIGLHDWFNTAPGQYLLQWERAQLDKAVADVFGYHAMQLGLPEVPGLQANRMPHQWLAVAHAGDAAPATALVTDFAALPFPENSLDLLVLPHSLEFSADPHATLREAARVLVPEGRVVICGLNPTSLWGWRQRRARATQRLGLGNMGLGNLYLPDGGDFIGYWRLRDWLRLLSFEVESGSFGCYRPAVRSQAWLDRMAWMDALGQRYWPILGAAYCVTAVKRVRGTRVLGPAWKRTPKMASAPVSVAPRAHFTNEDTNFYPPHKQD